MVGLEGLKMYLNRDISVFVMYYVYGSSGPSLLIESTDSIMRCCTLNQMQCSTAIEIL